MLSWPFISRTTVAACPDEKSEHCPHWQYQPLGRRRGRLEKVLYGTRAASIQTRRSMAGVLQTRVADSCMEACEMLRWTIFQRCGSTAPDE